MRFRIAHIGKLADPAERERKEQIVRLVKLHGLSVRRNIRAHLYRAGQNNVQHIARARRAKGQIRMRIHMHNLKRRRKASVRDARRPEIERLVVRVKDRARNRMLAIKSALLLKKPDNLLFAPRRSAALIRPRTKRRQRTGVREKKVHIQIQYAHGNPSSFWVL